MTDQVALVTPDLQAFLTELQALPVLVQKRIALGAVATACSVIRKASIALAPMYLPSTIMQKNHPPPGTLKRAIYQARMTDRCTPTKEVWMVGIRSGKAMRNAGSKNSAAGPTQGTNKDAYYAAWVEFGHFTRMPNGPKATKKARQLAARALGITRYVPPQPFMRPAFEQSKGSAAQAMSDYVTRELSAAMAASKFLKAA